MNIFIYGSTLAKAIMKMNELLDRLDSNMITIRRRDNASISNGDYYKAISADSTARGNRWHKAYIDKDIDINTLEQVILPSARSEEPIEFY